MVNYNIVGIQWIMFIDEMSENSENIFCSASHHKPKEIQLTLIQIREKQ